MYNSYGKDQNGQVLWYGEPFYKAPGGFTGTIRSDGCVRMGNFAQKDMCFSCYSLKKSNSFIKRVGRTKVNPLKNNKSLTKRINKCNDKHLSARAMRTKLKVYRHRHRKLEVVNFRLKVKLARQTLNKRSTKEKTAERARRGDIHAITESLHRAYDKGLITSSNNTIVFMRTVAENLRKKSKGQRQSDFSEKFYEVVRIWGGKRVANFIASNLCGPSSSAQKRTRRKNIHRYRQENMNATNFKYLAKIYKGLKEKHNIQGPVLCEASEDETAITKQIFWDHKSDQLWGFCGAESDNHTCLPDHVMTIGSGPDAFSNLQDHFRSNRMASYARVIMINPLNRVLPSLVAFLSPTCNTFTSKDVKNQWSLLEDLFAEHVQPVLGPLIGHASDGDARRRKAMMEKAFNTSQGYTVNHPNFVVHASVKESPEGSHVFNLMDQDFIHNAKKIVNPLDHSKRLLSIGGNDAHMSHVELVLQRCSSAEHGLRKGDVFREDRQNWEAVQRLAFPRVRECLQMICNGQNGKPVNTSGTTCYLELLWFYIEIFFSFKASLIDRISHASYVANFLRLWRLWICQSHGVNLKDNFITRETYLDLVISCHFVVLLIKATRDFANGQPVLLEKTGTDCCEDYFSQNGSFNMNKHTYSFPDMVNNLGSMNRLQEIRSDPEGPVINKAHEKQDKIWHKGNDRPDDSDAPDLTNYPSDNEIEDAWDHGLRRARNKALLMGI